VCRAYALLSSRKRPLGGDGDAARKGTPSEEGKAPARAHRGLRSFQSFWMQRPEPTCGRQLRSTEAGQSAARPSRHQNFHITH
jgi:hypothetical protein